MALYDGDTERRNIEKNKKVKRVILAAIIIICILICIIIGLMVFIAQQPESLSLRLNGKTNNELLKLFSIEVNESGGAKLDELGNPKLYAPIKEIAQYFGYDARNGNYMTVSEDTNSCNVKNQSEVAIFTVDSDIIYKKDLTNQKSNYETYKISEKVIKENEQLYTNVEGLEKAYNIDIIYDAKTNSINLYTLDYFVEYYTTENPTTSTTVIQDLGFSALDELFVNQKAILDNMIVVKNQQGEYGVINLEGEEVFSAQYKSLTYIPVIKAFFVQGKDLKYGIISAKKETLVEPVYDSLQMIDEDKQLYLVSENKKFGVIDIKGNIIVPLDYTKIGIDINQFVENNITNGYIIQDTLIPVQQDEKWGFYDLDGKIVGEGIIYENIGCITTSGIGTAYNVLSIPEYKAIVVKKDGYYGVMKLDGNHPFGFVADDMYIQISAGKTKYIMSRIKDEQIQTKDISEIMK